MYATMCEDATNRKWWQIEKKQNLYSVLSGHYSKGQDTEYGKVAKTQI